jgi:hypothetical protein
MITILKSCNPFYFDMLKTIQQIDNLILEGRLDKLSMKDIEDG